MPGGMGGFPVMPFEASPPSISPSVGGYPAGGYPQGGAPGGPVQAYQAPQPANQTVPGVAGVGMPALPAGTKDRAYWYR